MDYYRRSYDYLYYSTPSVPPHTLDLDSNTNSFRRSDLYNRCRYEYSPTVRNSIQQRWHSTSYQNNGRNRHRYLSIRTDSETDSSDSETD